MKRIFNHLTMTLATAAALTACQPQSNGIRLEHQGDTLTIVHITNPTRYLILPIQESCNEGKVSTPPIPTITAPSITTRRSMAG